MEFFGIDLHMLHVLSSQLLEQKFVTFSAVKMDQIKISVYALLVTRVTLLQHPFQVHWCCVTAPSCGALGP